MVTCFLFCCHTKKLYYNQVDCSCDGCDLVVDLEQNSTVQNRTEQNRTE